MKTHYQNSEHYTVTVRKLRTILGHHNAPNDSTVYPLIGKFEESGSILDNEILGRPRSDRSKASVAVINDSDAISPRKYCHCRVQRNTHDTSNNAKNFYKRFALTHVQNAINAGTQVSRQ